MASGDLLDVRVAALGTNLYGHALLATAGTAAAAALRADQPGGGSASSASGGGGLLLRSKLSVVEVALQDAAAPLTADGLDQVEVRVAHHDHRKAEGGVQVSLRRQPVLPRPRAQYPAGRLHQGPVRKGVGQLS